MLLRHWAPLKIRCHFWQKHPSSLENLVKEKVLECIEPRGKPIYKIEFYAITSRNGVEVFDESALKKVIVELDDDESVLPGSEIKWGTEWRRILSELKINRRALDAIVNNPIIKVKNHYHQLLKIIVVKQLFHLRN